MNYLTIIRLNLAKKDVLKVSDGFDVGYLRRTVYKYLLIKEA
jgi:hypothetical protein